MRPIEARRVVIASVVATAVLVGTVAGGGGAPTTARADCGFGPMFGLGFGKAPRLLPTLRATELLDCGGDGREYDYSVKGYFKVAGRTVARLPRSPDTSTPAASASC